MSEHDGTDEEPRSPAQPYPGQPYPGQPYPGHPYLGALVPPDPSRAHRPPAVDRLVQVMHAGAVAAVLQGVWAAIVVDDLLAVAAPDLDRVAAESGTDPDRLASLAGQGYVVFTAVSTVLTVVLWLVFARLLGRGRGRVAGTVLGAVNLLGLLWGLLAPGDLVGWTLGALSAALAAAGLVLLHRPAATAWFRADEAARRSAWT